MKKYWCIYKYTKGPQSTETDETDRDSDIKRQHLQNNIFFVVVVVDWGYMCGWCQTTKILLASQALLQCSSSKLPCCG